MASQDQGASGLAGRYAIALYDLAEEAGTLDGIADDLRALRGMLRRNPTICAGWCAAR